MSCCAVRLRVVMRCMSDLVLFLLVPSVLSRSHRGIRHWWGVRVRGQHTKTTGRRGKTVGPAGKK